jgi:hypothetical protein
MMALVLLMTNVVFVAVQVSQPEIVTVTATNSMSVAFAAVQVSQPEIVTVTATNSMIVAFVEEIIVLVQDVQILLQTTMTQLLL